MCDPEGITSAHARTAGDKSAVHQIREEFLFLEWIKSSLRFPDCSVKLDISKNIMLKIDGHDSSVTSLQVSFVSFQELIAYGTGNIGGSFTSCFAICNALARTAVQENLANTQV